MAWQSESIGLPHRDAHRRKQPLWWLIFLASTTRLGLARRPKQWRSMLSSLSDITRNATRRDKHDLRRFQTLLPGVFSAGTSGTDATAYVCRVLRFFGVVYALWESPARPNSPYEPDVSDCAICATCPLLQTAIRDGFR